MRPSGTDDGTNQGMAARCFRAFSLHTNAIFSHVCRLSVTT